jgi:hypothetical protein
MSEGTLKYRNAAICLAIVSLLLLLAGCAGNLGNGGNADNDRNSGFYGGMTGGGSRL